MRRSHEKERIAAITAGLAIVVLIWIGVQAFEGDWLDSLGDVSPWLFGPVSVVAWGVFSTISYFLIIRAQRRNPALCQEHEEATREARTAATADLRKIPKCEEVSAAEHDRMGAVTAGFAVTIAVWLAILSFAPGSWMDALSTMSPWIYCLASLIVWSGSGHLMYMNLRRSRRQQHQRSLHQAR